MACQSKLKEKFRKEYVPSESGQLVVGLVTCLYSQTAVLQKCDHFVCHINKILFGKILAVEVKIFRKPVNTLDKTKVSATDECQFAEVLRGGKVVVYIPIRNIARTCSQIWLFSML